MSATDEVLEELGEEEFFLYFLFNFFLSSILAIVLS